MSNLASERLIRLEPAIMEAWETRAIAEVEAAKKHNSLILRNSLPEFLKQTASALSTIIDRTAVRIKWDLAENLRLGKKHGNERANTINYTIDQLIFEYHILRQVICETMEAEAPLSHTEREIIICAVEQAVNDAATEFSDATSIVQEKITNTLAHDLRNPVTAAKMSAQLLLKKPNDIELCIKIASRISSSMDQVDLMIHDLLDASKIRNGQKLEMKFEPCDLDLVLEQATEELNYTQQGRIKLQSCGSLISNWNERGMRRVIDNLLTNALKFSTPHSKILVTSRKHENDVIITVKNEGSPIPIDEILELFDYFKRVKNSEGKVGWGLGLTVVKGITEAHQGQVAVESSDAGTIFKLTIPMERKLTTSLPL